jgi:hypothetical protein
MKTSTSAIVGAVLIGWVSSPAVALTWPDKMSVSAERSRRGETAAAHEDSAARKTHVPHASSCGCASCCALLAKD